MVRMWRGKGASGAVETAELGVEVFAVEPGRELSRPTTATGVGMRMRIRVGVRESGAGVSGVVLCSSSSSAAGERRRRVGEG